VFAGPCLAQAVFFAVWFLAGSIDWHHCRLAGFAKFSARGERRAFPPGCPLGGALPWARVMIRQTAVAADRGRGCACARAVGVRTSRGAGTSVTARTPNACARSGAGRRRSGRPGGAWMRRSKPSKPRLSVRAVSALHLRRNPPSPSKLRQRVVTQQKFFAHFLCDRPGCCEPPPKSGRSQARYCCCACRQAVALAWPLPD
jgi:hypothetical protein